MLLGIVSWGNNLNGNLLKKQLKKILYDIHENEIYLN